MKFNEEIKKLSEKFLPCELCLSVNGGYFIGVKKILNFTNQEIWVLNGVARVKVTGTNLSISKLVDGDLGFTGKISKVEWEYQ